MDEPVKDLLKFLGIIAILGVVWFVFGGKQKTIEDRVNVKVTDSSGKTVNNTNTTSKPSSPSTSATTTSESANPYLTQKQYESIENKSPYFKLATINRPIISGTSPEKEYIQLSIRTTVKAPIGISDWTIRSTVTGKSVKIGKAVLLPSSQANPGEDPIFMRAGEKAYLVSGRSPIGKSFLANKCIGYFAQFNSYSPSLSLSCPALSKEELPKPPNALNDKCLDYLISYPKCRTQVGPLPESLSHECRSFILEHANYNSCVNNHKNDADFFSKEWRIYLNRNETMWKTQREKIELLDENGKVVDVITY